MKQSTLAERVSPCCELDSFAVSMCTADESQALNAYLPECRSVIVIAHHVRHPLEWVWFPLESERYHTTCPADLHVKSECDKIISALRDGGCDALSIPYPGRCGVRFKDLAHRTGLGRIGDNFLFLHREWGPWTHLRVIATTAQISDTLPDCGPVCTHCGRCREACPASAIREDGLLGVRCDAYQESRDAELGGGYLYKCEECARVCPIGTAPERIVISACLKR